MLMQYFPKNVEGQTSVQFQKQKKLDPTSVVLKIIRNPTSVIQKKKNIGLHNFFFFWHLILPKSFRRHHDTSPFHSTLSFFSPFLYSHTIKVLFHSIQTYFSGLYSMSFSRRLPLQNCSAYIIIFSSHHVFQSLTPLSFYKLITNAISISSHIFFTPHSFFVVV